MESAKLQSILCDAFCSQINVHAVPAGLAIATPFEDGAGDKLTLYVVEDDEGCRLEDDGDYLATLVAQDMPITEGVRGKLLDAILNEAGAFWDRDSFEIRTSSFATDRLPQSLIRFISALMRIRDLEFLSRDNIKSTFREDFIRELDVRAKDRVEVREDAIVARDFSEFPSDLVVRDKRSEQAAAVFLVNSNDKLNEALLAWIDREQRGVQNYTVIGVIEDSDMSGISRRKFQRAQNRRLPMPIFRGDEDTAINMVLKEIGAFEGFNPGATLR